MKRSSDNEVSHVSFKHVVNVNRAKEAGGRKKTDEERKQGGNERVQCCVTLNASS